MPGKPQDGPWIMPRPIAEGSVRTMHQTPFWEPSPGMPILVWSGEDNAWLPTVYRAGCKLVQPGTIWKPKGPPPDELLLAFAAAYRCLPDEER